MFLSIFAKVCAEQTDGEGELVYRHNGDCTQRHFKYH